ncbi:hypothetical protein Dimus_033419, partial [Dionaea muscipula]
APATAAPARRCPSVLRLGKLADHRHGTTLAASPARCSSTVVRLGEHNCSGSGLLHGAPAREARRDWLCVLTGDRLGTPPRCSGSGSLSGPARGLTAPAQELGCTGSGSSSAPARGSSSVLRLGDPPRCTGSGSSSGPARDSALACS